MNLKRILNVVGVLLLIAIVIPFVIYAMPITVGADHSFVVLTASMTPAIAPGDVVIVADRDPATIGEGDVITFTRGDNEIPVTHRVTAIVESASGVAFETKGDANSDPDASFVPASNVVGTVILTIPYIGYVIQFTNTPYGFAALVAVPIGLFVVSELWTLYRQQSVTVTPDSDHAAAPIIDEGSEDTADTPSGSGGFVITPRTLEGALLPLLALAIYSSYTVSVRLTEITVSVAVGSVISLLALSVLVVSARRQRNDASTPRERELEQAGFGPERPTADGGVDRDPVEPDLSLDSSDDRGVGK
jgi:signal peptidase